MLWRNWSSKLERNGRCIRPYL